MSDILRRAFDRAVQAAERRSWTPGRLGMTNIDGTVTISVPDRPNWVYVALGPNGSQGVTVARNDAGVPLRVYLPVKMRREDSGVMAIQGVYNAGGLADVGASSEAIYTDYGTTPHKHGGDDIPDAVLIDGTRALTANWDVGETWRILSEGLRARSTAGLRLEDDAGNLGVYIKDGGNVGIGTASPTSLLDVNGTLNVTGGTSMHDSLTFDNNKPIVYKDSGGLGRIVMSLNANDDLILGYGVQAGNYLGLAPGGSVHMAVLTDGKVGIGTLSPITYLHILSDLDMGLIVSGDSEDAGAAYGQIQIRGATDGAKRLHIGYDTTANNGWIQAIAWGTATSPLALNPRGGNVGIGTDEPSAPFQVSNSGGTGGGILTASSIVGTEQTLLAEGTVTKAISGSVAATDGSTTNTTSIALAVPSSSYSAVNITLGSATLQFRAYSTGKITIVRISGTGTSSFSMAAAWT